MANLWPPREHHWNWSGSSPRSHTWGPTNCSNSEKNGGKSVQGFRWFLKHNIWIITNDNHSKPKWWLENPEQMCQCAPHFALYLVPSWINNQQLSLKFPSSTIWEVFFCQLNFHNSHLEISPSGKERNLGWPFSLSIHPKELGPKPSPVSSNVSGWRSPSLPGHYRQPGGTWGVEISQCLRLI